MRTENNRTITTRQELDVLQQTTEALQDVYRARGIYQGYEGANSPEERAVEEAVYDQLSRLLPLQTIDPAFRRVSRHDLHITLPGAAKPVTVEIKAKREKPTFYIGQVDGRVPTDRTAGVPKGKINQLLEADYAIFCRASVSCLPQYLASTTDVVGIVDCKQLRESDFETSTWKDDTYAFLPLPHPAMIYKGENALSDFAQALPKGRQDAQKGPQATIAGEGGSSHPPSDVPENPRITTL